MTKKALDLNGKQPKIRKSISPKRLKRIEITKLHKQTMTILGREIEQLLELSYKKKLDSNGAKHLVEYLKLINELKALKELEELEKPQQKGKKNGATG